MQAGDGKTVGQQIAHNSKILSAVFSPDGSVVLTSSEDGSTRLWDARTGKPRADPLVLGRAPVGMEFGPDGNTFITDFPHISCEFLDATSCGD